jgi:alanine racemase
MADASIVPGDETTPPDAPDNTTLLSGPPEAEAGGVLTIDLAAIKANWRQLLRRVTPAEAAAVIKADGYGCGLEPVTALLYHAGCRTFFVADIAEGRRARRIAPEATIYVLNGLPPRTAPVFAENYLRPVIGSLPELAEWDTFVGQSQWRGGIAIHVDTGMNRLGLTPEEAAAVAARMNSENHGIALIMSHFVAAQIGDHPLNERQIRLFREIRAMFRGVSASLANSSGIFLGASAHCDLVRPGAALFGVNPTPGEPNPMRPVITLQGRIVQLRQIESGATVGYDAVWTARRPARIAIASVGYADGYPRTGSATDERPGGEAIVAGQRCPLAGRVSMDLLAIDVSTVPEGQVRRGDLVTLIGGELDLDKVAARLGTIGYEILTRLGHRYARIYRNVG